MQTFNATEDNTRYTKLIYIYQNSPDWKKNQVYDLEDHLWLMYTLENCLKKINMRVGKNNKQATSINDKK